MNIERFAGDNDIIKKMAVAMQSNEALMERRQGEAMNNAYQQRARDVAATGVKGAGRFL